MANGTTYQTIVDALTDTGDVPVIGVVWSIGQGNNGQYFVSERWEDGAGRTSWHSSLTDCLDDLSERIDTDTESHADDPKTLNSTTSYSTVGNDTVCVHTIVSSWPREEVREDGG